MIIVLEFTTFMSYNYRLSIFGYEKGIQHDFWITNHYNYMTRHVRKRAFGNTESVTALLVDALNFPVVKIRGQCSSQIRQRGWEDKMEMSLSACAMPRVTCITIHVCILIIF